MLRHVTSVHFREVTSCDTCQTKTGRSDSSETVEHSRRITSTPKTPDGRSHELQVALVRLHTGPAATMYQYRQVHKSSPPARLLDEGRDMTFGPGGLDFDLPKKERSCPRGFADRVRRDRVSERHDAPGAPLGEDARLLKQTNKQLVARSAICLAGAGTSAPSMSTERFSSSGDGDSSATSHIRGEWQGSVCVTCALRAILIVSSRSIIVYTSNIDSSVPASVRGA